MSKVPSTLWRRSRLRTVGHRFDPALEARQDGARQDLRRALAPVLPGEVAIEALPAGLVLAGGGALAREPKIGDRDDAIAHRRFAVAVGEGIELLDIAQRMMGLAFDPGAHAGLQGRVIALERAGGQQGAVLQGQDLRLVIDQRHQHCIEFDGDGTGTGGHAGPLCPFSSGDARSVEPVAAVEPFQRVEPLGLALGAHDGVAQRRVRSCRVTDVIAHGARHELQPRGAQHAAVAIG